MASYIDKKYINMVSVNLSRFQWKNERSAVCRCPICGDSAKNALKRRGHFYLKHDRFFYKCFNCGYWSSMVTFLKEVSPTLGREYALECFAERAMFDTKGASQDSPIPEVKMQAPEFKSIPSGILKISSLGEDHEVVQYLRSRSIPERMWCLLRYTDDFRKIAEEMNPETAPSFRNEARLLMPFHDEDGNLIAVQGRALGESYARYLTIKSPECPDRLWFRLNAIDPDRTVVVVEGPLDSLFLKNAVAMVGSGSKMQLPSSLLSADLIFMLDNEPRNKQIVNHMRDLIQQGRKVCILPSDVAGKDINDIMMNAPNLDIEGLIESHCYTGLKAMLKINEWDKS